MKVLGIESTCDETAASVVKDGHEILSNVISSQIELHKKFGGVVPELASRSHVENMMPVIEEALTTAKVTLKDIDLIAVAKGPGLIGALLVGMNAAKALSLATGIPFIGVNHIEAHLYATLMTQKAEFPALGVILSGGHTSLVLVEAIGTYKLIGQTVDDAIGEAFDKTAKLIGLPYPGGPEIEKLAKEGNFKRFPFKPGRVKSNPFAFSFSGLKTAALYAWQKEEHNEQTKRDIAASFQKAAFDDIIQKSTLAATRFGCKTILFGGGVTNSRTLREWFKKALPHTNLLFPDYSLTLDNAAMIAGLGTHLFEILGRGDDLTLLPMASLPLISLDSKNFYTT